MKKLIGLALTLTSFAFIGSSQTAEAATGAALGKPQVRIELGQRRHRRPVGARGERIGYGRTFTRVVRRGWHSYRETYQVRYLPHGMTRTVLISRVRVN